MLLADFSPILAESIGLQLSGFSGISITKFQDVYLFREWQASSRSTDSDMAGDVDSRKSTSGYLVTFAGGAVSWQSKLQKCVALSTTEAEFIAATEACKDMLWMKRFLQDI